eukprot:TRINITY_DN1698_c0_g1_i1.p1 TRINITY_DN1698_c0_g1~~TRINITY_DN1698_c0_g1_i1.p1  ORF type:complete len:288 (+),score=32.96 TRINITY_DN1698_c0_g1_i1:43-906(+)
MDAPGIIQIKQQYHALQLEENLPFIAVPLASTMSEAQAEDEHWYHWRVSLRPETEFWEGLRLPLTISFAAGFDQAPPEVQIMTILFHPNIEPSTGKIVTDWIRNWHAHPSIYELLHHILAIIDEPDTSHTIHPDAAELFSAYPDHYHTKLNECKQAIQRMLDGKAPNVVTDKEYDPFSVAFAKLSRHDTVQPAEASPSPLELPSFDEYRAEWSRLAVTHRSLQAAPSGAREPFIHYDTPQIGDVITNFESEMKRTALATPTTASSEAQDQLLTWSISVEADQLFDDL